VPQDAVVHHDVPDPGLLCYDDDAARPNGDVHELRLGLAGPVILVQQGPAVAAEDLQAGGGDVLGLRALQLGGEAQVLTLGVRHRVEDQLGCWVNLSGLGWQQLGLAGSPACSLVDRAGAHGQPPRVSLLL